MQPAQAHLCVFLICGSVVPEDSLHGTGVDGLLHGGLVLLRGMAVSLGFAVGIYLKDLRHGADAQAAADAGVLIHNGFHGFILLKNYYQQHLELLFPVNGMRVLGGHDDGLALVHFILHAVNGDAAHAVQAGDKGIAAGFMGADLLILIKGKKRHADSVVLHQRAAYDLTRLTPG